ncbi:hypothetical protein HII31_01220 [Pseudocercospora fuligena]|uniref:Uncharacterized protein n=1 Tax=Pseudocercospora fuligena TaxID=685502 RepID=A0A8H6VMM9_9PEZI|nr:hypothetical protein HII31_01220 [Pseudocercospora fuligena]
MRNWVIRHRMSSSTPGTMPNSQITSLDWVGIALKVEDRAVGVGPRAVLHDLVILDRALLKLRRLGVVLFRLRVRPSIDRVARGRRVRLAHGHEVGEYHDTRYEGHGHNQVAEWHMDDTVGYIQIQNFGWHAARRMALDTRAIQPHLQRLGKLGGTSREHNLDAHVTRLWCEKIARYA